MTEKVTVKTKINEALKWWWASFELEHSEPKNGIVRLIVALAAAVSLSTLALLVAISLIVFIASIKLYILMSVIFLIAYFQTPQYKWSEVVDYIKKQAKSVFGGAEQ